MPNAALEEERQVIGRGAAGEGLQPDECALGAVFELVDLLTHDGCHLNPGGGSHHSVPAVRRGVLGRDGELGGTVGDPGVLKSEEEMLVFFKRETTSAEIRRPEVVSGVQRFGERVAVVVVALVIEGSRREDRGGGIGEVTGRDNGLEPHERVGVGDLLFEQGGGAVDSTEAHPGRKRPCRIGPHAGIRGTE